LGYYYFIVQFVDDGIAEVKVTTAVVAVQLLKLVLKQIEDVDAVL